MNSISYNPNNNVNFTAKMDIRGIKTGKAYWENLSRMFEQSTKQYPNDTIVIKETKTVENGIEEKTINSYFPNSITEKFEGFFDEEFLKSLSDKKVISMFKKLLKANHNEVKLNEKAKKFEKSCKLDENSNSMNSFWDAITAKMDTDAQKAIGNDPLLRDSLPYLDI